jgi:hypothetical protein
LLLNAELDNQKLAMFEPIVFGSDKRKDEALNMLHLFWLGGRGIPLLALRPWRIAAL